MNGEMFNICAIIVAAKQAIKSNSPILYNGTSYENSINFHFLSDHRANGVNEWFEHALKLGLSDVRLTTNLTGSSDERLLLSFSNSTAKSIICIFKEHMSCFVPYWKYNKDQRGWDIIYKEFGLEKDVNLENFSDNTEAFVDTLTKIAAFADEIECENFGECFRRALKSLGSSNNDDQKIFNAPLMPKPNLALFTAASAADVFGGMGSWNDDAAGLAQHKKRAKEYDELSGELFTQMRKATLFAINEW
ncbi:hypothetical protein [Campylobacter concisus]|uniref:hypothetical protein n=1 Tax=Campylobacter concisus TaxID=199 RepID=UPI00122D12AE|nr:hypothetical protein [Campylobacter concisus]